MIDDVPTILYSVHGALARGAIVNEDLTLTPCYVYKQDNFFAHGDTPHEAREAAMAKAFDDMPEEDRIELFVKAHSPRTCYLNSDFFAWHHRLTGSCEMGRRQFAKEHGLDLETGSMTPEEFIRLTANAYGGATIRKLRQFYPEAD